MVPIHCPSWPFFGLMAYSKKFRFTFFTIPYTLVEKLKNRYEKAPDIKIRKFAALSHIWRPGDPLYLLFLSPPHPTVEKYRSPNTPKNTWNCHFSYQLYWNRQQKKKGGFPLKPYPGMRYFVIRIFCHVRDSFWKSVRNNKNFPAQVKQNIKL